MSLDEINCEREAHTNVSTRKTLVTNLFLETDLQSLPWSLTVAACKKTFITN